MDITWYGRSCFRISERGQTSVVTDPYKPRRGKPALKLRADVVTVSHDIDAHRVSQVKEQIYVISSPGEYEVGELFVTGMALHHHDAEQDIVLENVAYRFEYLNQLNVLHLGNLRAMPDQAVFEQLDEVNVLLLPVNSGDGMSGEQIAEIISLIEPGIVVPMNFDSGRPKASSDALDGFFKAMGIGGIEAQDSLRVTASALPEQTQVALLNRSLPVN